METSSILDRIMASKEDQAKQAFNPAEVMAQLLRKLSTKEADVLQRRYGLSGVAQETLEAIGASYRVTRERIRQIENLAITKIKADKEFGTLIKPVEHVMMTVLEENGGIMEQDQLLDELFPGMRSTSNDQAILFILSELIDHRFKRIGPDHIYNRCWALTTTDLDFVQTVITQLVELIRGANVPMDLTMLQQAVSQQAFFKQQADTLNQKILLSYLEVSRQIDRNPFDEYGLADWGSVIPRRMNDKIYLVLKKVGQPMHFVDIAKKITEIFKKEAYPPTVHNELILNKQYVLVGRGMYALQEWGYQRGVVADVIIAILKRRGKPMGRDDIVAEVLQQRMVKKNTIHLALTNKEHFTKLADGRYVLSQVA